MSVKTTRAGTKTKADEVKGLEHLVPLAQAWQTFRNSMLAHMDGLDSSYVELGFESSYDEKTHYNFNNDEAVFLSDITISPNGNVVFVCPFGSKEKTFHYSECELINLVDSSKEEAPMNTVVNQLFREAFKDVEDVNSVTMLERKMLLRVEEARNALSDPEAFLKSLEVAKERSTLYSKIEEFGIF